MQTLSMLRPSASRPARPFPPVPSLRRWLGLALVAAAGCGGDPGAGEPARVGFLVEPSAGEGALKGAEMGVQEAAHAARLVGRSVTLLREEAASHGEVESAARRLVEQGVFAIVGGFDEASCSTLGEFAEREGVLFLNVGCRADPLRVAGRRNTLHIEASQSMYDASLVESGHGAVLWHDGLTRYGAAQLNERFQRAATTADPAAWASWMAVKVLWEAVSRTGSTEPAALLSFLEGEDARFDGHKGEPLVFEPRTGQLRQPLYPLDPAMGAAGGAGSAALARHAALPTAGSLGDGEYLFVSNEGSLDVTVIDLDSGEAVARIPLGHRPRGLQVAPNGERLYVALSDNAPLLENDGDAVAVIDLRRGEEIGRYPVGSDPEQFGLAPDGLRLYAANEDAGTATATDIASGRALATVVVGIEPEGVAVSPDGRWVYVTAETSNTVSVIDTQTNAVVASFLVDVRPRGVAFSPAGDRAYVTNEISGTLSVVDTRRHAVLTTVELGAAAKPVGVVVSPDGGTVYVANGHGNSIAVVDAATHRLVGQVPVGRRPWGITLSRDGSRVYTANGGSNDVSVVDAERLEVLRTIPVGERPWGVALRAGRGARGGT